MDRTAIEKLIPHRDPFLWVDRILEQNETSITTSLHIDESFSLFRGHYPDNPIMPGVILCEMIFQSGALLMAAALSQDGSAGVPVLTKIENAKFKRMVKPGDLATCKVELKETLAGVSFFKGKLTVNGKTAVSVAFACAVSSGA